MRQRLSRLAVATLVAAAGMVGAVPAPASAALCSGAGVNVVVDPRGLGGGVQQACDPSGAGKTADRVFPAAGFPLTYAQRSPGFVCRVKGAPSSDPCVNASPSSAYWGLYWSDGKSGRWTYSSTGVGGLKVPSGGFVAFSWQNGGEADPPGVAPVAPARPTPAPTRTPTAKPTPGTTPHTTTRPTRAAGSQPGPTPTAARTSRPSATGTATAGAAPSASASSSVSSSGSGSGSASTGSAGVTLSPTASESAQAPQAASPVGSGTSAGDAGLPLWVPAVVLALLGATTGGALWWRRRAAPR